MKRDIVVVTGGAGYIGTHVVDRLLQRGCHVRVLDALLYGAGPLSDFLTNTNFEFIRGDAADVGSLRRALRGANSVVHLAGVVGDAACAADERYAHYANVAMTACVNRRAAEAGVSRFIFASSCSVYGTTDAVACENDAVRPLSLYARTKAEAEAIVLEGSREMASTILRFGTAFGHSRRPRFDLVANAFTAQAVVDGIIRVMGARQRRPFVFVGDLARAVDAVLLAEPACVRNQVFNVANDDLNVSIGELAERVRVQAETVRPVVLRAVATGRDLRNYTVTSEKIRGALGFAATTSLETGIAEVMSAVTGALSRGEHAV